jgi:AcrR family transcriptional regulator
MANRSGNFKKEDLRIKKTKKILAEAMFTLLETRHFAKITVFDICDEALVSRAAFYAHFTDKYALLRYCLSLLREQAAQALGPNPQSAEVARAVWAVIQQRKAVLMNMTEDANDELRGLLADFFSLILSDIGLDPAAPHHGSFTVFCAGGLLSLLLWQAKKGFSTENDTLFLYISDMIKAVCTWQTHHS